MTDWNLPSEPVLLRLEHMHLTDGFLIFHLMYNLVIKAVILEYTLKYNFENRVNYLSKRRLNWIR